MFTIIITLLLPLVSIGIWRQSILKNNKKSGQSVTIGKGEYVLRYLTCLLCMLVIPWILLSLTGNDGNTILRKLLESREYAVKVLCLEISMMLVYAIAELFVEEAKAGKHEKIRSVLSKITDSKAWSVFHKYIGPVAVLALTVLVVCLNFSMMSDRVLWGDEAFSANTAHKDVDGILQVLYYWDNHPPLYYYWLKLFGTLFGYKVPVFHLASLVPFVIGIVLALTVVRKHFGMLAATFFVMISGLGQACLEYNLEVRMYALAFLCVMGCFYCSYRVIADGSRKTWAGMVLWALAAAYSHYYALVAVGIMMFFTGVAVWIKYRGKTWINRSIFHRLCTLAIFLLCRLEKCQQRLVDDRDPGTGPESGDRYGRQRDEWYRIPVGDSVSGGDPGSGFFCILCGKRRSTYAEAFCEKLV